MEMFLLAVKPRTMCCRTNFRCRSLLCVNLMYSNSAFLESLTSRDQNEYEKRHHDLARQYRDDTRNNPGNANLGNLDAEGIFSTVRDHFKAKPKRRVSGNGISENKIDFLTFIEDIQAALPSDPQGKAILSLVTLPLIRVFDPKKHERKFDSGFLS